jgi:hypothetical protein
MNIHFTIPEVDPGEKELLKSILHCEDHEFNEKLNKVASAAFEEYRKMILGQKVFTRGRDIIEYRLFIFIKYFFGGKIPEEQKICDLFQVTATETRSLIRSIMSKYQYELRETIITSVREEVQKIVKDEHGEDYKISIQNQYIKDELNRILGTLDTSLPIIEKDKGTISTYIIKPSSYQRICDYFNVQQIQ